MSKILSCSRVFLVERTTNRIVLRSVIMAVCPRPTCRDYAKKCVVKGPFKVVMIRHGESEWNRQNLFTGWYDAPLSAKGHEEAKRAGKVLKETNHCFDIAFTSVLTRANETLDYIRKALTQPEMTVVKSWRLNERHYGALTGMNKSETADKFGEQKVLIWRRSFDVPPPPMEPDHKYYKTLLEDKRYASGPPKDKFPMFESLKMTLERTIPFWEQSIVPAIQANKKVIIAAHGNSLRAIIMHICNMSSSTIMDLNLPTGIPFFYKLGGDAKVLPGTQMQFLGDPAAVKKAMQEVAQQGKKK